LKTALRTYWLWLSGLVVSGCIVFFAPNLQHYFFAVAAIFIAGALMAAWPCIKYDAPYSFWAVACALWFSVPFVLALLVAIFEVLSGRGAQGT
jgi:hypothetical protein